MKIAVFNKYLNTESLSLTKEILSFNKIYSGAEQVITAKYYELLLSNGEVLTDTMSGLWKQ